MTAELLSLISPDWLLLIVRILRVYELHFEIRVMICITIFSA